MISEMRMREIAEKALSWIVDNGDFGDFCEDQGIELNEDEQKYFGIIEQDYGWETVNDDEMEVLEDEEI